MLRSPLPAPGCGGGRELLLVCGQGVWGGGIFTAPAKLCHSCGRREQPLRQGMLRGWGRSQGVPQALPGGDGGCGTIST